MRLNKRAVFGIVISLLLLWWVLRDVSLAEVFHELRQANLWLFVLAIALNTLGFAIRAERWRVLLLPLAADISFRPRFAATNIGFAANNLLPARVGEFARAYSLSRLAPVSTSAAFGTLFVERLLDALVLVVFLFVAMASPGFPLAGQIAGVDARMAAVLVALVAAVAGLVAFLLVLFPESSIRVAERLVNRLLPASVRRPIIDALESFLRGMVVLREPRLLIASIAWAVAQWFFLATTFLLAFRAFGITEVGLMGAIFLQSLIGIAVAVPSSPGFFGPFEAAAKLGLGLWAVPPERAVSFAIGFHIGGFIPVTVIGLYYVWRLGLSWKEVEQSEEAVEEEIEEDLQAESRTREEGVPRG